MSAARNYGNAGQTPRRFIYMALDKDAVFETVADPQFPLETPEARKLFDDSVKLFDELWNDGCA